MTAGGAARAGGIGLHVIEQGIDTSTMEGRAMFGMLSAWHVEHTEHGRNTIRPDNMNTATNHESRWLFPGRREGQPMHPYTLSGPVWSMSSPDGSVTTRPS